MAAGILLPSLLMRFPITLWRHIAFEVWRVVFITALVLVCVVSFAAVVKFLGEGRLGPVDALRFMAVIAVPMMHYTLPFAAGFGATLAYHRMTADGEITAAHASGIGHRWVLVPAFLAALVLGVGLGYLNQQTIPHMLRASQRMVTENASELVRASIESSQSVSFDNFLLHAEGVKAFGADAGSGASERMLLTGVVAVEFDRKGQIRSEATAARAWLWIFPAGSQGSAGAMGEGAGGGVGSVRMRLEEGIGVSGGQLVRFSELLPDPWLLPDAFSNDPKFYTYSEMSRLRAHPEEMSGVEQRRARLAQRLAERETMQLIRESLRGSQRVRLVDQTGQAVIVHGSDIRLTPERRWAILARTDMPGAGEDGAHGRIGAGVAVDRFLPDGTLAHYVARGAEFVSVLEESGAAPAMSLRLVLTEVSAPAGSSVLGIGGRGGAGDGVAGDRTQLAIAPLFPPSQPLEGLMGLSCAELLERARVYTDRERPDAFIAEVAVDLKDKIQELEREILSKVHERWAMSGTCLVMAVAGAVTAMRLGSALPLMVYLWSFFPALVGVITIMAGQQLTHDHGAPGLVVLWGGVGLLVVYTVVSYLHVARH